jgi:hypothetical protein
MARLDISVVPPRVNFAQGRAARTAAFCKLRLSLAYVSIPRRNNGAASEDLQRPWRQPIPIGKSAATEPIPRQDRHPLWTHAAGFNQRTSYNKEDA